MAVTKSGQGRWPGLVLIVANPVLITFSQIGLSKTSPTSGHLNFPWKCPRELKTGESIEESELSRSRTVRKA